jgi:flagellar biosynthesis component FlhA
LDELPSKIMAIEAKVSEGSMKHAAADRCKFKIQRLLDLLAAIDGTGRLLYLLLKIHLLRLGLQILGSVAIYFWSNSALSWRILSICSSMIIVDGVLIFAPYMLLIVAIALLNRQSHLDDFKT